MTTALVIKCVIRRLRSSYSILTTILQLYTSKKNSVIKVAMGVSHAYQSVEEKRRLNFVQLLEFWLLF